MNEEKLPEKLPLGSTIAEIVTLGDIFTKSGLFPDITSQAQAVVKILAGREMGFPPIYSMRKIYIIRGQTVVAAEAMGSMIKRSRQYNYHTEKLDNQECILQFTDDGKDVYCSKYTMEDAQRAEVVKQGSGWVKFPRAMLFARALSQGARIVCPHIIMGAYTPEDFGYTVNDQDRLEPLEPEVTEAPIKPTPSSHDSPVQKAEATELYDISELQRRIVDHLANDLGLEESEGTVGKMILHRYGIGLAQLNRDQLEDCLDWAEEMVMKSASTQSKPTVANPLAKAINYLFLVAKQAGQIPDIKDFEPWCQREFGSRSDQLTAEKINIKIKELKLGIS